MSINRSIAGVCILADICKTFFFRHDYVSLVRNSGANRPIAQQFCFENNGPEWIGNVIYWVIRAWEALAIYMGKSNIETLIRDLIFATKQNAYMLRLTHPQIYSALLKKSTLCNMASPLSEKLSAYQKLSICKANVCINISSAYSARNNNISFTPRIEKRNVALFLLPESCRNCHPFVGYVGCRNWECSFKVHGSCFFFVSTNHHILKARWSGPLTLNQELVFEAGYWTNPCALLMMTTVKEMITENAMILCMILVH